MISELLKDVSTLEQLSMIEHQLSRIADALDRAVPAMPAQPAKPAHTSLSVACSRDTYANEIMATLNTSGLSEQELKAVRESLYD
jgi:hypothetical protein